MTRITPALTNAVFQLIVIVILIALWEGYVYFRRVPTYLLPKPSEVFLEIFRLRSVLARHTIVTMKEVIGGFLLGASAGFLIGFAMAWSRTAERVFTPLIVASQSFPKEALAPLFVVWLGFDIQPKIVMSALICFFPVAVNTVRGLLSPSPEAVDVLRSMAASRGQVFLHLRLPASLPYVFAALRISVTLSLIGAIVAEFVGSSAGLGHVIMVANAELNTKLVFGALLLLSALGLLLYGTIAVLEAICIPWAREEEHWAPLR